MTSPDQRRTETHRAETHHAGQVAELWAAAYLMLHGWRIVARRFRTPVGEIDIVARRGRVVSFIEVKKRAALDDALYAVRPDTAARVRRAAQWWLKSRPALADKCDIRFDVVALAPYARIRHISNAF